MNAPLGRLIAAAFDNGGEATAAASPPARRRRRLWELPTRWHCPLIGSCVPVTDLRRLAARAGFDVDAMSDYTLHTIVVGSCDSRKGVAEALQRLLEKRYAAAVARFSRVRGEAAVLALWAESLASGADVAGALWAAWSHADLSEDGGKAIYGDIHMLSHQVGAAARADLDLLQQLRQENSRLHLELQAARESLARAQREHETATAQMSRRLEAAEGRAMRLERQQQELDAARAVAAENAALRERAAALAARVATLEARNAETARRAESLAAERDDARQGLAAAEAVLEQAMAIPGVAGWEGVTGRDGCGRSCPAEAHLAGRCVLCIGGRAGLVDGYRRLVEASGGRFLHHDGGQEESLHRIDAVVAGADAVVCQAGCVSHAAYYRLKDACKKLGKPCVFVQSPGIGSFARGLAALAGGATADGAAIHFASRGNA